LVEGLPVQLNNRTSFVRYSEVAPNPQSIQPAPTWRWR